MMKMMKTEFSEKLIENCERAITNLKRAIVYNSNLPNVEAKEALEASLLSAQRQVNSAVTNFNDFDCPMANNSIATFTVEEYF